MFTASIANGLKHLLRTDKWDAFDMYFNTIFVSTETWELYM